MKAMRKTVVSSISSSRSFPSDMLRRLQLAKSYYLRNEGNRSAEEVSVVEYQAERLIPTIVTWWRAGYSRSEMAEMADEEARSYYDDGRGLQAYVWDYASSILWNGTRGRADWWQEEWQFLRRYSFACKWVKDAESNPWRTEDFKAAIEKAATESWSSSHASWDGVPYRYDNGPWPSQDRFYRLKDGSVLGVNWDGYRYDTVKLTAIMPRLTRNNRGKLIVW